MTPMTTWIPDRSRGKALQGVAPLVFRWQVEARFNGVALDTYLAEQLGVSKNYAEDLIDFGSVQIEGRAERNGQRILTGMEKVVVYPPRMGIRRHYEISPERIIYQDRYLLLYDKEAGIPSQATPADAYNNLFAALRRYLEKKSPHSYIALHHRLDKEASGLMIFALDRSINRNLSRAFQNRKVIKDYLILARGHPTHQLWVVAEDIGREKGRYTVCVQGRGKPAETAFHALYQEANHCWLWARPRSGRTHQIRLHLARSGHPILGDRLYGGPPAPNLYLHAYRLIVRHPQHGGEMIFLAPVPSTWPEPPGQLHDLPRVMGDAPEKPTDLTQTV